jgi:hypothetical protein
LLFCVNHKGVYSINAILLRRKIQGKNAHMVKVINFLF